MTNFDEILTHLGSFGTYQKRIYFLLCLTNFPSAFNMMMSVFLLGTPKHRCKIPGYINDSYEIQSDYHRSLVNLTIPPSSDENMEYDPCHIYIREDGSPTNNITTVTCSTWVYDTSVFLSTFASENMVCGDKWRTSHAQMVYFAGVLVGSFGLGSLSDIIGRKTTMCVSLAVLFVSSLSLSWSTGFVTFCILRFVVGVSCAGMFITAYVIGMELVGPSKRVWTGNVIMIFFAVGILILAGVGYVLRDWKYIEITCSAPTVLFLVYWWFIPESPRWLISKNRLAEANSIIQKAAKVNKVELPTDVVKKDSIGKKQGGRVWHLFTTRTLAVRSLITFFNWMTISMTYYGLSLNSGNLGGNLYLNFFLTGVVEIPALLLVILLLDRIGRGKFYCGFVIFGGVSCICTIFTLLFAGEDLQPITVTLAMLGKFGLSAAYSVVYVWSAELFPTVVRNAAMGMGSSCARIGGMISPYVADLSKHIDGNLGRAVPLAVFGSCALVGGLLAMYLPETLDENLSDTIKQGCSLGEPRSELRNGFKGVHKVDDVDEAVDSKMLTEL